MTGVTTEQFRHLVSLGGQMANVCFNLGQHHDSPEGRLTVESHVLKTMHDLDRQWRAKVMEIGAAIGEAKKRRSPTGKKKAGGNRRPRPNPEERVRPEQQAAYSPYRRSEAPRRRKRTSR